jgi:hypothetical protein
MVSSVPLSFASDCFLCFTFLTIFFVCSTSVALVKVASSAGTVKEDSSAAKAGLTEDMTAPGVTLERVVAADLAVLARIVLQAALPHPSNSHPHHSPSCIHCFLPGSALE